MLAKGSSAAPSGVTRRLTRPLASIAPSASVRRRWPAGTSSSSLPSPARVALKASAGTKLAVPPALGVQLPGSVWISPSSGWVAPPVLSRARSTRIRIAHRNGRSGSAAASSDPVAVPLAWSISRPPGRTSARPARSVSGPVAVQSVAKPKPTSERSGAQRHASRSPLASTASPRHSVPLVETTPGYAGSANSAGIVQARLARYAPTASAANATRRRTTEGS